MLFKKAIKLLSITILSLFFISNSFSIEPRDFIQQTVDKAAKALDQNLSKDLKISKLKIIALKTVDIKGIGFYSLGKYRKNLNDERDQKLLLDIVTGTVRWKRLIDYFINFLIS